MYLDITVPQARYQMFISRWKCHEEGTNDGIRGGVIIRKIQLGLLKLEKKNGRYCFYFKRLKYNNEAKTHVIRSGNATRKVLMLYL